MLYYYYLNKLLLKCKTSTKWYIYILTNLNRSFQTVINLTKKIIHFSQVILALLRVITKEMETLNKIRTRSFIHKRNNF